MSSQEILFGISRKGFLVLEAQKPGAIGSVTDIHSLYRHELRALQIVLNTSGPLSSALSTISSKW
jgi:hypothetical protein